MDSHRKYICDRCRICAGRVDSDKRRCEVYSFKDGCKALWNVEINEDSAEIHPVWTCHKCRKTLSRFQVSQKSGKRYQTDKKPFEWLPHSPLNCICSKEDLEKPHSSGPGRPSKASGGSETDTASETEQHYSEEYNFHILNEIRRLYSGLPAQSALQLASELGDRHGFVVIDVTNMRNSMATLDSSVLTQLLEIAVSLTKESVKTDASSVTADGRDLEELMNIEPEEWFKERAPIIQGIVHQFSDSKTPTIAKVVAAEHLYSLINRNLMSPFSFAKNVVSYSLTPSKRLIDLNGKMHPGGGYSTMKSWLANMALDLLPFPNGDALVAFDNVQIVQKRWTVRVDNKAKVSILTSVCHSEVEPNGNLQRKADLSPR